MYKKVFAMILAISMIATMWIISTNAEPRITLPEGDSFAVTTDVVTDDFKTGDTIKVKLTISDIKEGLSLLDIFLKVDYNPYYIEPDVASFTSSCEAINANDPEVDWDMQAANPEAGVLEIAFEDGEYWKGLSENGALWVELVFTAKADNTSLVDDVLAYTSVVSGTESVNYDSVEGKGVAITALLPTPSPTPTASPTPIITEAPSAAPSEEPNPNPSEEPSAAPSDEPVDDATPAPTAEPAPEEPVKDPDTFDIGLISLAAVALSSCTLVGKKRR